ncbi:hypothetical protein LDVICp117 [lymphocystis disease virus-China]|uniref:Uncharacterized protein n=2 Tax=Lymphocystis disease virus 2 TaxID=159183 RepID=A0A6F8X1N1_9VIRU|nr:hypothetical protein LDVICp117 [lymphocystis disease virus-China]AAU10962.1 hypothetical protein [lymphocystis disease virus-China]BCB67480.1 hypothetical protein [Lymphocystis disease virus 2]
MIDLTLQNLNAKELKKKEFADKIGVKTEDVIDINLFKIIDFLGFFNNGKPGLLNKLCSDYFNASPLKGYRNKTLTDGKAIESFKKKMTEFVMTKIKADSVKINKFMFVADHTNFKDFVREIIYILKDLKIQKEESSDPIDIADIDDCINRIESITSWCLHEANSGFFVNKNLHPLQIYDTYDFELKPFNTQKYLTRLQSKALTIKPLKEVINFHLFSIIPGTEPFYISEDKKTIYLWSFTQKRMRYWIKDPYALKFSYFLAKNLINFLKSQTGLFVNQNIIDSKKKLWIYVYKNILKLTNPRINSMDYFKI